MQFELPDGNILELPDGATGADAAAAFGPGLARAALAVKVDGELRDLDRALPAPEDGPARIEIVTDRSGADALWLIRHDAAHVLAESVLELYPGTKVSIGPPIEDGFYYDFEFPQGVALSEDDLEPIEVRMREHIKADERFVREDVPVGDALERFVKQRQDYKVELIEDLIRDQGVERVSLYTNGDFTDLCAGPHAPSTKRIGAVKLQSLAGAYWRGDASQHDAHARVWNGVLLVEGARRAARAPRAGSRTRPPQARARARPVLVLRAEPRLSVLASGRPGDLERPRPAVARAEHRPRLPGGPHPDHLRRRAVEAVGALGQVPRPHVLHRGRGAVDGAQADELPGPRSIYKTARRSHRDLPLRMAEQGLVHRHEPSGTLHGLLRVRSITQDDAHIFCTDDQVEQEVIGCLEFAFYLYDLFGLEPRLELSTRPPNRIGSDAMWDRAEGALRGALDHHGLEYDINEGDGAFYGPKIDLHTTDSIGRSWQLGTVQLDYAMPERFGITYTGADNAEHTPVMIHRALFGSFERFMGILIEHYAGEFPLWLAPVQAIVLPIADRHIEHGGSVLERMRAAGLRAELDDRDESVGRKIRDAELRKIPFMLVVGDREQESDQVGVREHRHGDRGSEPVDQLIARLQKAVESRATG